MEVQEMLWSVYYMYARGLTSSIICAVILPENVWLWRPLLLPFWCPFWDDFWLVIVTANSTPSYSSATCISERLYIRFTYKHRKSTVLAWLPVFKGAWPLAGSTLSQEQNLISMTASSSVLLIATSYTRAKRVAHLRCALIYPLCSNYCIEMHFWSRIITFCSSWWKIASLGSRMLCSSVTGMPFLMQSWYITRMGVMPIPPAISSRPAFGIAVGILCRVKLPSTPRKLIVLPGTIFSNSHADTTPACNTPSLHES